jgi:uncharacterized membrane protein
MVRIGLLLLAFYLTQVAAMLLFKVGSLGTGPGARRRWLAFWVTGNLVGTGSVAFLVKVYELMPQAPNLAAVLGTGGTFIACQLAFALVFRSHLTRRQWAGIAIVAAGTMLTCLAGRT